MPSETSFTDFMRRIRAGDAQAAAELVRKYESAIRLEVHMRLSDLRLRRSFDSLDICQSVLASFFVRAAAGQFDLEDSGHLVGLLVGMARKKLAHQVRKQRAARRDHRRNQGFDLAVADPADGGPDPCQVVAGEELLREFRLRLSTEERRLADLRLEGSQWDEIAREMGGTGEARRKQLERALDRVSRALGLEDSTDE